MWTKILTFIGIGIVASFMIIKGIAKIAVASATVVVTPSEELINIWTCRISDETVAILDRIDCIKAKAQLLIEGFNRRLVNLAYINDITNPILTANEIQSKDFLPNLKWALRDGCYIKSVPVDALGYHKYLRHISALGGRQKLEWVFNQRYDQLALFESRIVGPGRALPMLGGGAASILEENAIAADFAGATVPSLDASFLIHNNLNS